MATLSSRASYLASAAVARWRLLPALPRVCPGFAGGTGGETAGARRRSVRGSGARRGVWAHLPARSWDGPRGVKSRNVVIGAGSAPSSRIWCSRKAAAGVPIIGGRPAFMAPEVAAWRARPAAGVWRSAVWLLRWPPAVPVGGIGNSARGSARIGYMEAVPRFRNGCQLAEGLLGQLPCRGQRAVHMAQLLEHRSWPPPLSR
ncbi:hypothetical protein ZWY2020_044556 [Hordeum vulgare]|nr:hypothetical protein ZWY2020_044556 [Hordeum vulgare]